MDVYSRKKKNAIDFYNVKTNFNKVSSRLKSYKNLST